MPLLMIALVLLLTDSGQQSESSTTAIVMERTPLPIPQPPMSFSPTLQPEPEAVDRWGWRFGPPDTAPAGRNVNAEFRLLSGTADLDNRYRYQSIGTTVSPRIEYGVRDEDGIGGAAAFGSLAADGMDAGGVRRRFNATGLDFDLLLAELRPLRLLRMNARVGLGLAWLDYRRYGGGDLTAPDVPTYDDFGPLAAVGIGTAAVALAVVSESDLDSSGSGGRSPTGSAANPRAQEEFGRSFLGAAVHVGLDEVFVLGRSGTALFASGDLRAVGGMRDSALAVSGRTGLRVFRRSGRYRLQFAAGYCVEHWWLNQAGFDWEVGLGSMAAFRFHGPFAQTEFKF